MVPNSLVNFYKYYIRRLPFKLASNHSAGFLGARFLNYKYHDNNESTKNRYFYNYKSTGTRILIGSAALALSLSFLTQNDFQVQPGVFKKGLPYYTREEVAAHISKETGVWLIYKEGVYDVTDYLSVHPGGEDTLMEAAGKSLEPLFEIYAGHNVEEVFEILESLRIGNLKLKPNEECCETKEFKKLRCDYFNDPERNECLKPLSTQPFVGGPEPTVLIDKYLTSSEKCFIHNHMPVPNIDLNSYKLVVDIRGKERKEFTLDDLKAMPQIIITATMQCAANRSGEMAEHFGRYVQGPAWAHNAIYNAEWKGVLLLDVLKAAGYSSGCECNPHVAFESIECMQGTYSTSIPLWRVIEEKCDVLLAWEMNGEPLSRDHGFPLRVIIPGVAGTRWVKNLERIILQDNESKSKWHIQNYRMLNSEVTGPTVMDSALEKALPINEMPVNSAICKPYNRQTVKVKSGQIQVEGYAWSGGGQKIARVEVSIDKGKTWIPAKITKDEDSMPPYHWTWAFWSASVPIQKGTSCVEIWAKATDNACNTQPDYWIWNFGGVACNAMHKLRAFLE